MGVVSRLVLLVVLALAVCGIANGALAQSDNDEAVDLLPPAAAFGDGWVLLGTKFPPERHPAFRAATTGIYGGPDGARIVIDVMLVDAAEGATYVAWDRAIAYQQWYEAAVLPVQNPARDQQIAAMDPPPECQNTLRLEAFERIGGAAFPVGVTFCAETPETIFVAAVSGTWDGLAGVAASDAVIGILGSLEASTPTP